jgi:hypothetical protein
VDAAAWNLIGGAVAGVIAAIAVAVAAASVRQALVAVRLDQQFEFVQSVLVDITEEFWQWVADRDGGGRASRAVPLKLRALVRILPLENELRLPLLRRTVGLPVTEEEERRFQDVWKERGPADVHGSFPDGLRQGIQGEIDEALDWLNERKAGAYA